MARVANLQTLHNHYKTYVTGINFPNQLSEYEDYRQALLIAQERAYELVWFAEDHQNNSPEWYEVENLWDTYTSLTGRDPEAELSYSTNKRKYVCGGVDLGDTLGRSKAMLGTWIRDLQAVAQALARQGG